MEQKLKHVQKAWALTLSAAMAVTAMSVPQQTVTAKTAGLSVKKKVTVYVGVKKQLKVKNVGSNAKLTWKSSNKNVVRVNKKGVAIGVKPGKATIKCKVKLDGKTVKKNIKVTVKKPVKIKKMTLKASSTQMTVGTQMSLGKKIKPAKASVKKLKYTSSDEKVAEVSKKGVVTAKAAGTVKITAKTTDGSKKKDSIYLTVVEAGTQQPSNPSQPAKQQATGITISASQTQLTAGDKLTVKVKTEPAGAEVPKLRWTSSDPFAATVSDDGTIEALAQGVTTITAQSDDGRLKASLDVTVDYDRTKVNKPRVCITNDGEIDDKNSYVHLLYYANEIDLVGLVQTSSFAHWAGSEEGAKIDAKYGEPYAWPGTDWQNEFIDAYAEIYPNLRVHDENYPTPNYLKSVVKIGNIGYTGDMDEATEGSEHIKNLILDDVPGPLYITAWGGMNTVGRALKDIYEEYGQTDQWESIRQKIYDKVRIYMWYGQDGKDSEGKDPVFDGVCAKYYPELTYVDVHNCNAMGWGWENATTNNGKEKNKNHQIPEVYTGDWMLKNLENPKFGPLMDWYVTYGDGTHVVDETYMFQFGEVDEHMTSGIFCGTGRDRYDFLGEGDTPTYLSFFDMGLDSLENYGYGSVAGRFVKDEEKAAQGITNYYIPENDTVTMSDWADVGKKTEPASYDSGARWVTDIMNAFAARVDWGITSDYDDANHRPDVTIKGGNTITAEAGERVTVTASANDPDGDDVSFRWFNYKEAGTYGEDVAITGGDKGPRMSFIVPEDAETDDTIHFLVRGTDDGDHNLTYYQRVIVTVE